jgi:hypothetical protein
MTVEQLREIISDLEDSDVIYYQAPNNINKHLPIKGFEVVHFRGQKRIVLTTTKILPNEYNG